MEVKELITAMVVDMRVVMEDQAMVNAKSQLHTYRLTTEREK